MTFEEMKTLKTGLGLTNEMIAKASGIPLSTVQKIFSGATKAPRKLTLDAISRVLTGYDSSGSPYHYGQDGAQPSVLKESSPAYQADPLEKKKRYTLEDYYALPDERRVELIDGVFYDMASPTFEHQEILGRLYMLFQECIEEHGMPCHVLLAPTDVRLDQDNYTMVQPDLVVMCRNYDPRGRRYEGAPDLLVEILSPSTRSKDQLLKLHKYHNAGVREYWIIDAKFRRVTVHCFEREDYAPEQYGFTDEIPVGISEGNCSIDFSRVLKYLE